MGGENTLLGGLLTSDVHALRLAAQVMRHKADLDGRPIVAEYFEQLRAVAGAELAARGEGLRVTHEPILLALGAAADREDRRVLAEYFGLLIGNERLSPPLREVARRLRSRDCREDIGAHEY